MTQDQISVTSRPEPLKRSPGFKMSRAHHRAWSPKLKRFTNSYSPAEWTLLLQLEGGPAVRTYCEHFPSIDEFINGKRLRFVFTFWVEYRDGREVLISVVKKRDLVPNLAGDMEPLRWRDICTWCTQHGLQCRFVVEGTGELKNSTLTINWAQILPYVRSGIEKPNADLADRVHAAVRAREIGVISDLSRVFPAEEPGELNEVLFVLLHAGRITIDLALEAIHQNTKVGVTNETPITS
jgi:hypothetical protein